LSTIIDDDGGAWNIADDGVSVIRSRSAAGYDIDNYDYWLVWKYGTANEEYARIQSVSGSTMTLRTPVTTAGSGLSARVQLFPRGKLGDVDWGERHFYNYAGDWGSRSYRDATVFNSLAGHQLAALALNLKTAWAWDAFFDFQDYHMETTRDKAWYYQSSDFVAEMWEAYRRGYGPIWPAEVVDQAPVTVDSPSRSPIGHWGFNEGVGMVAVDTTGNNAPAQLINGPQWSEIGKIQGSLNFDGIDDYVTLGTSAFELSTELTVAFWMRPSDMDFTGYHAIIQRGAWVYPFTVTFRDRSLQTCIRTASGTDWLASNAVIQPDRWYHVALTREDGARVMYLDGEIDITDPTPPGGLLAAGAGYETTVGAWQAVGGAYFKGHIDDLRIYNAALSASDIRQLYKNGCRSAEWAIDGFSGTTAPDDSGNNNPGTLANGPLWSGGQIRLDGINDKVDCGAGAQLNQTSSLTLCAWICPDHYGLIGDARIVDKGDSPAGFAFYLKNDGRLAYMAGSAEVVSDADAVRLNEWQHVAVSYSDASDTVTFYVDGQPAGTVTSYQTNPTDSLKSSLILGNNTALTCGFKGMLTDVRIYSRALEASEIKAIYETWEVKENKLVAFDLTAVDSDGHPLEYVIQTPAPAGTRFEGNVFTWRPWYNQSGSYDITFEALDNPDYTHRVPIVVEEVALASWYRYWLQCLNRY